MGIRQAKINANFTGIKAVHVSLTQEHTVLLQFMQDSVCPKVDRYQCAITSLAQLVKQS